MINTISMCILGVILSYISAGIINRKNVRKENSLIKKAFVVFPKNKRAIILCSVILIYMIALAIVITNIYDDNICGFAKTMAIASLMFPMAEIDGKQMRIPNKIIVLGLIYRAIILVAEILFFRNNLVATLLSEVISALVIGVILIIFGVIIKNGIGMGDVKYFMIMALFLGQYKLISAVLIIMLIAFFVALFKIIVQKANKSDEFAFGPIIAIGSLISFMIFGN